MWEDDPSDSLSCERDGSNRVNEASSSLPSLSGVKSLNQVELLILGKLWENVGNKIELRDCPLGKCLCLPRWFYGTTLGDGHIRHGERHPQ